MRESERVRGPKDYESGPMFWSMSPSRLPASAWVAAGGFSTATIPLPTFDFRPDLVDRVTSAKRGGVLMYPGATLYVQVAGLLTVANTTQNLRVFYREFAHITDANRLVAATASDYPSVAQVTGDIEITSSLVFGSTQPPSVVLPFQPMGGEGCARFWRLELVLQVPTPGDPLPDLFLEAAAY